jgi:signal peptidase I
MTAADSHSSIDLPPAYPAAPPDAPESPPVSPVPHAGTTTSGRSRAAHNVWAELFQTMLLTLVIFFGVRGVVQRYRVEGVSMEPTLHNGEYLWVNKAVYFHLDDGWLERLTPGALQGSVKYVFGGPQRGDIAVFKPPREQDKDFVKRVIGLPGDTILIRNGQVIVNGKRLDEPYIRFSATYNYPATGKPLVVPNGSYFVLGDNRPNSSDSHFGWVVPADNLIGQALTVTWPLLVQDLRPKSVSAGG